MNRIRIFLTSILLFVSLGLFSQSIYPVQVNTVAIYPYSRYLSDYYSGTEERLSVTLLNRDTQQPEIRVKLRLTIRNSDGSVLTTKPEAWFTPIILESGIPQRLTMQDLSTYFRPDKLNAQGSFTNETLAEGRCEFRFEALDYFTGRVLSSISMAAVSLDDLKPPTLQQPLDKQNISFSEPINIVFRWSSSQNNFGMVEYEFTLKEIIDKQANVNSAFLYASTIYKTSTYSTSLPYTADFPLLEPSKRYAWQVRASLPNETGNKNRFENNGLSTIFYFDLREDCQAPMGVNATTDRGKILVSWSPVIGATKYAVQYRRKDFDTDQWYEKFTDDTQLYITDITLGNEYAYQVGTVCSDGKVVYGYTAYIKVPLVDSARMAKCGVMPQINISNTKPKNMLKAGDKIMAGDFPVILTQVSGGNGTFSGEGYSTLPYIGAFRLAVKFENIGVNEENKLISGFIETKYDESAGGIYNADALTEGGITSLQAGIIKPDITVNYIFPPIPTIEYDAAANVMSFEDGAHQPIGNLQVPKNELGEPVFPFTVQDASNTVYQVDEEINPATGQPNGKFKFTKLGQQQAPIAEGSIDENLLDYNIGLVTFENTENARYTLDGFLPYYDNVSIIRYNSNMNDDRLYPEVAEDYHVQWKFIPEGATDQVTAKLQIGKDNKIDPAKVIFKSKTGTVFEKTYNEKDKTFTVTLSGAQADSRQDIFALHPSDREGKYWNLGKLYIDTRAKPQAFKVVLVNLGGDYNKEDIRSGLNNIYNKVGIAWQVEEYNDFTSTEDLENLFDNNSGLLSAYNDKMRAINSGLIEKLGDNYDPAACYVLMMKTGNVDKKDRNVTGFMPRGNQFCYIYTAKMDNLTAGIAHELGHGKFKLKHTFDSEYGNAAKSTEGTTDNLMDYSSGGVVLTKWQWDEIYNPAVLNAVFDGDGEGMIVNENTFSWIGKYLFATAAATEQEKKIDEKKHFYDYIYTNYDDFFIKSKSDDIDNIPDIIPPTVWSVRKESHSNNICKKVFEKLKDKLPLDFNLSERGIYLGKYTLNKKTYRVAVYSEKESCLLTELVRVGNFAGLKNSIYLKVGYSSDYGLIVLYDFATNQQITIQILSTSPIETTLQWLNYLGLVVQSQEQEKTDESLQDKLSSLKVYDIVSLIGFWDEEEKKAPLQRLSLNQAAKLAVDIASEKYPGGSACNICVRSALYIFKNEPALFPKIGSDFYDPENDFLGKTLKGFISGDGLAIYIKQDFNSISSNDDLNQRFEEINKTSIESWQDLFIRLQNEADKGELIIGVMLTSNGASGHIVMITQGGVLSVEDYTSTDISDIYNFPNSFIRNERNIRKVPRILECGEGERKAAAPLCTNIDYNGAINRLKWYKYKK